MFEVNELLKATQGRLIDGRRDFKIKAVSIDSRTIKPQEAFVAIKGNNFNGHDFIEEAIRKGASCVISEHRTPNTEHRKITFIKVKDTIKALGDIACFQRNKFNIPVIAVTGSNGKTTTKEMLSWVLSDRFEVLKNEGTRNNQIGLPLALLNLDKSFDLAVLEIGTNHFGEVEYLAKMCQPNIGIITNIGPAHLEYFGNLGGVFGEKYALIENLKKPYLAILNADDILLRKQLAKKLDRPLLFGFGIENNSDFCASNINNLSKGISFFVHKKYKFLLNTLGYFNIYNALAAITVARIFGMEYRAISKRLAAFKFPAGRFNFLKLNKINFIDDTYNSNPLSLARALDTLVNFKVRGRKIFVMGDMLELGNRKESLHAQVGKMLNGACDVFITVGGLSQLAAKTAQKSGFNINNIFICGSTREARDILFNQISPCRDDLVLVKGSRAMKMEEIFKTRT